MNVSERADAANARPLPPLSELAHRIRTHVGKAGDHRTVIPSLTLHRRDDVTDPLQCVYGFGLTVVVQGSKRIMLGERIVDYSPGSIMLTSANLPVISHVTQATRGEPFLALVIGLEQSAITMRTAGVDGHAPGHGRSCEPLLLIEIDAAVIDALLRLVRLLDEPALTPHLAPLVQQEIVVRLMAGPYGPRIRKLVSAVSPTQQISHAVEWIKQNFMEVLRVDELANRAHMSPSTFRQHFRSMTGTSPVQFQKQLRLQEARQLMLNQDVDAVRAAALVGYGSASQFSREYSRLFGTAPQRDVRRLRCLMQR